jgi:hypothetical protein
MEKLIFDGGIREYVLGRGVLRFNPLDPNVYERFMEAATKIEKVESELVESAKALDANDGGSVLALLKIADKKAKDLLNYVFGSDNDFDYMLGGVNVMAVAANGERVITNLFQALTPILEEGARECAASFAAQVNK